MFPAIPLIKIVLTKYQLLVHFTFTSEKPSNSNVSFGSAHLLAILQNLRITQVNHSKSVKTQNSKANTSKMR